MSEQKEKQLNSFFLKNYKLIAFIIAVLILWVGYIFLVSPAYEKWQESRIKNITLAQDLAQKAEELKALELLKQEYEQIDPLKIQKMNKMIPQGADLANLYVQLDALAKENNLVLSSVEATDKTSEPVANNQPENLGILDVHVQLLGGNYNIFKKFLSGLENNLRIFDVKLVSFPENLESLSVNFQTYYLK